MGDPYSTWTSRVIGPLLSISSISPFLVPTRMCPCPRLMARMEGLSSKSKPEECQILKNCFKFRISCSLYIIQICSKSWTWSKTAWSNCQIIHGFLTNTERRVCLYCGNAMTDISLLEQWQGLRGSGAPAPQTSAVITDEYPFPDFHTEAWGI